jgi:hypothetical protein
VSNGVNCNNLGIDREQHSPVASAQSHSSHAFEGFDIAGTRLSESCQFTVDLRLRNTGQFAPLPGGR